MKPSRQRDNRTLASKVGLESSHSLDIVLRIAMDRLLNFLCDAPLTRDLPGIRYLAPHSFERTDHHLVVKIPLENVRTCDIHVIRAGSTLTVVAHSFHENGQPKMHWSEGVNGYGTWRRRYQVPPSGNLQSLRVIPGRAGAEIVLDETGSIFSIAA